MGSERMRLPAARGPLSRTLLATLTGSPRPLSPELIGRASALAAEPKALEDGDLQVALLACYELHYRGLEGVDDRWEWEPSLLAFRAPLEAALSDALAALAAPLLAAADLSPTTSIDRQLRALLDAADGPSLSKHLQHRAGIGQFREYVVHRSLYQLKEADPHTWAIPRLSGRTKAALVEIQADEYGGGRVDRMHAVLFARTMRALGLDDTYGGYVDVLPATTLAAANAVSLFGLHRRWRGALLGHLAVLEMDSSVPNRRYADGLRRLGQGPEATDFYDEHVEADAVHEQVAVIDMCGSFVRDESAMAGDVLHGAACCITLDLQLARSLLDAWGRGSSLLLSTAWRAA